MTGKKLDLDTPNLVTSSFKEAVRGNAAVVGAFLPVSVCGNDHPSWALQSFGGLPYR